MVAKCLPNLILRTLIIFYLSTITSVLYACSCSGYTIDVPLIGEMERIELENSDSDINKNWRDIFFNGKLIKSDMIQIEGDDQIRHTYYVLNSYNSKISDTIQIYTNPTTDMCGFNEVVGGRSFITGLYKDGRYYTYRTDCVKSVSEYYHKERYGQWKKILDAISEGRNGSHKILQPSRFRYSKYDTIEMVPAVEFGIQEGRLHGDYTLYDRRGNIVEKGKYNLGEKMGVWQVPSKFISQDFRAIIQELAKVFYEEGHIQRIVIEREYDYETFLKID